MNQLPNSLRSGPDASGHFGAYGGRFVAETLMPLVLSLEKAYEAAKQDPQFHAELSDLLTHYVGRESPLYLAERLTAHLGGAKIYLKREDLNHTGAHKINNCLGQILLAKRMGKTRIIAETGAGQHGVATATVAARFGLPCTVYMGEVDMERQKPNVFRMRLLGAEVRGVSSGSRTLKDATNEALRDWVANVHDTFYIIGSVVGPHPYPAMVRDFQTVIGNEARQQMLEREKRLPDLVVACVGGGSNAAGMFHPFVDDSDVAIHGVEAAGDGVDTPRHAATLSKGSPGVLHGARSYLLQDSDGQIIEAHSISAGLDYPGVGPEHSWLKDIGRVKYFSVTDQEALDAFMLLSKLEGIIPALESAHAIAHVVKTAPQMRKDELIAVCLSGRGDKDIFSVAHALGEKTMSRLSDTFARLRKEGRAAFVPFITAGDPDMETSFAILQQLPSSGADVIELGMPFTDPMADGPAVQASSVRALKSGATMAKVLKMVEKFRKTDKSTPIVLMGYYNPIHAYGTARFARDVAAAGVDGLIVVDLPIEEDEVLRLPAKAQGVDLIRFVTPTTDEARLKRIAAEASGYLYYVSVAGVTGTKAVPEDEVRDALARVKAVTDLPCTVGFGIRNVQQADAIARMADGVVVGSAIVSKVAENINAGRERIVSQVLELIRALAGSTHAARRDRVDV